ncbi:hypothetical protein G6O69_29765 [Pseudenhygromyxa sp. WMMC2535]|uniref:hypothetical protein n=1 Tax=Pseudenhygromyxa sp. WMMC2535 TaxID=2712867 RepID=UPI001551A18D|nr:hypothetical protein [Pseudenhygromyxa sp. WMMC2535]NVB42050.1 hypothetical protein [Pseudenhygromyxa sp. WMMC2535]
MAEPNPIEQRLDRLYEDWDDFAAAPAAKLLRWQVVDNEWRMIELFFRVEDEEDSGQLPVIFVRLDAPYHDARTYTQALYDQLSAQIEDSLEQIGEGFIAPPTTGHALADLLGLADALADVAGEALELLVLVFTPTEVLDPEEWASWLGLCVDRMPPSVRGIVIDELGSPTTAPLDHLANARPEQLRSELADLAMLDVGVELADHSCRQGPDADYRRCYAQMFAAIGRSQLDAAVHAGAEAQAIARAQGWGPLTVAVDLALGSGHLQTQEHERAIELFHRAREQALELPDEQAPALALQAQFGMGAAAIAAGALPQGAQLYAEAAQLAEASEDSRSQLDALRMQAHCLEFDGKPEQAWLAASAGFGVAEGMDEETRRSSTLAWLGVAAERLASRVHAQPPWPELRTRLEAWIGPSWRALGSGEVSP